MSDLFDTPEDDSFVCPHCGAKHIQYRHKLNKRIMEFLFALHHAGGDSPISDLRICRNSYTNAAKARYWNLIEPVHTEESERKKGHWRLTETGRLFMRGEFGVMSTVVIQSDAVVRFEGELIRLHQAATPEGEVWRDYANQVVEELRGV